MKRLFFTLLGLAFFITPSLAADVIILPMGGSAGGATTVPLELLMEATDPIGIEVDGTTNDYTGADAGITALLQRDINRTGDINNYAGWQSYLNLKHTAATIAGDFFAYGNITRMFNDGGTITNPAGTDRQYWEVGAHNTVKEEGNYDTAGAGVFNTRFIGTYSWVWADTYDVFATGGAVANVFEASGLDIKVEHVPTLNGAATGTFNSYGIYVDEVTGSAAGTSTAYGIYIANAVSGADTNYAFYSADTDASYFAGNAGIGILPVSGTQITLPSENDAVTPTLAFGDGNTGFYESTDDVLNISIVGVSEFAFTAGYFGRPDANGGVILDDTATATVAAFAFSADEDTGIGRAAADQLSLIAGGVEGIRITEDTTISVDITGAQVRDISTPNLTASNAYAILGGDYTVLINDSDADVTGAVTVALPAVATSSGRILHIKKIGSAYTVTLDGNAAETIDGAVTQDMTVQYSTMSIQCNGSAWYIL